MLGGLVIGVGEAVVIALGALGADAQVLWYGPLAYAAVLGGLGLYGGVALGVLPLDEEAIRGWTPSLVLLATFLPIALFIAFLRLQRDVYLEQMPPRPVLLSLLGAASAAALLLVFVGPRLLRGRLGAMVRLPTVLVALLGVTIAGGATAAWLVSTSPIAVAPRPIPAELADRPNVILVMVDTLRADHLSCYGGEDPTPALCSLADDGGTRLQGFAHSSWTRPSAATLLSSTLPSSHGVMSKPSVLSPDVELVSEVLQRHGYASGGIVSSADLAASFGFRQGYDEYHDLGPDSLFGADESSSKLAVYQLLRAIRIAIEPALRVGDFYPSAETVNESAFDFLDRHARSRFFLFLHYMDPHDPYFEHPQDGTGIARATSPHPDPERVPELKRLYREEIQYLDRQFAKLLGKLRELGIWDDTLVVLVSDHGEEFHEHGGFWHGTTLYDEQIAVPFLVKWARGDGLPAEADGALARLLDVAPTLIARTGARIPEAMQGLDLVTWLGGREPLHRMVYAEQRYEGNVLRAIRTETWKWMEANEGNPRGLPRESLFDVSADPGEQRNVQGEASGVAVELREHADALEELARSTAVRGGTATQSTREPADPRALGRLGDAD
jgi:arylsulfatase A-like enzyme